MPMPLLSHRRVAVAALTSKESIFVGIVARRNYWLAEIFGHSFAGIFVEPAALPESSMKYKKMKLSQDMQLTQKLRDDQKRMKKAFEDVSGSYTANPLPQHFHFFTSRLDCTGRMSISALMKCTAAIRQMAYGSTPDAFDEYLQMSEHTARDALFFFNMCIIELYMPKYLRKPTSEDVVKIQQKHNNVHGFPGMLGSIDCMHWEWKNCPVSWKGQYGRGDKKYPTIMLEAVASQDLWIWHAFYGMAGANNDINVLDNSPLFDDLLDDLAPVVPYVVNGVEYRNGYYLADGIYPEWASFVKSFTVATDPKHTYFKQRQESARKDVERAFGVLQGRWGLIQQPARAYEVNTLRRIMYAGIIMHNMILEDQNMSVVDLKHVYSNPARIIKMEDGDASSRLKSGIHLHTSHAQTTKTSILHQEFKNLKAQELKTKTSAQTTDIHEPSLQRLSSLIKGDC
ncbi:ALP1-like protein [Tanacetum coccineum]|uniref:ALP1-like protein n=1 Tax=Tanacetum coccineum TaxID=301880 RepID=A0ABQ4YY20_9ASTR